jgi:hypothetical protein
MFPEARFIHLIRDGRNVALSYMEIEWGPSSWEGAARRWRERVEAARGGSREIGAERYFEMRYEELVEYPERSLRSLCNFVQLEYHPAMLQYQERAGHIAEAMSYSHRHLSLSRPPTKGLRDWRIQMPPDAVKQFEALAGDLLTQLGYESSCR